jgi:hypothetical protein
MILAIKLFAQPRTAWPRATGRTVHGAARRRLALVREGLAVPGTPGSATLDSAVVE